MRKQVNKDLFDNNILPKRLIGTLHIGSFIHSLIPLLFVRSFVQ